MLDCRSMFDLTGRTVVGAGSGIGEAGAHGLAAFGAEVFCADVDKEAAEKTAELGPRGVRVNTIAPGAVETPLTAQMKESPDWYEAYAQKNILGRWAKPHEIVGMMVYLASDASSYVTGAFMLVDGGWTAADGRFTPPL
jgi:NAD(P)-dependent dehydrogenase (short-subunit alcohol dehydrogenase family)